MKYTYFSLIIGLTLFFFLPAFVLAADQIGVGVGTGKIVIDEPFLPGKQYKLPPLTVINTGTVPASYSVGFTFHENQPEKRPDASWFTFSPQDFPLEPGQVQTVEIETTLPLSAEPGEYFAYLEASPIKEVDPEADVEGGSVSIGIAAAAKFYFTVEPANIWQALFYRAQSLYTQYRIPILVGIGAMILFPIIRFMRKNISFSIQLKKSEPKEKPTNRPPTTS